ncbi:hypothetical protein MSP7336_01885 [Mycobacterium shimoidei]|uniref:Uncharacterized protein n=1 Tax=Mycobacterium shimoidei TaxID=29313 RepID=A0A375YXT2_MYCSH|nr:hypothetical protein [Mycobacterium shimoidei]SRX93642.1 hypothetical protein MSP7336_01885 [Mycobacterium shimoidei]
MSQSNGPLVVGVGGTLRTNSSTERALLVDSGVRDQLELLASQVLMFTRTYAPTS